MSTRPLRQYYEPVIATVPDAACDVAPWLRHRERLLGVLRALTEAEWRAPTRCAAWDVKGVVSHLVTVDQYWVFALDAARRDSAPTTLLEHFDPATATDIQVATLRDVPHAELLDRFAAGTQAFVARVESFTPDDWDAIGESPLGHLPARLLFGHAFWDSWLHERDIFEPLGRATPVEPDELLAVTCFCLVFAGLQGGLLGDTQATGSGLDAAVDIRLRFDDLPDTAVRVQYDTGSRVDLTEPDAARSGGSAVALVEAFTGRGAAGAIGAALPENFAGHLARAALVL
jgi:uncharacterized protein (TIGR03083 family)